MYSYTTDNPLIIKLLNKLNSISHSINVIYGWIPSHIGIQENDKGDSLAKSALNMVPNMDAKIPHTNLKHKNQANNDKEIATTMGPKCPQQALPNIAHSIRKETGS